MKKTELTNDIINKIREVYKEEWSIRNTRDKVSEILDIKLTYHNVRNNIWDLIEEVSWLKNELDELNEDIKENKKLYEVDDTHYKFILKVSDSKWNINDKEYNIEISTIDNIFKDFSKYWNNLSSEDILQKYKLKPEVFNMIKSRLRLYKSSHILSPITLERAKDWELDEYIQEAINSHIQDKYKDKFINTYEKTKEKDYKVKSKILSNIEYTLEHINKYLEWYKPKEYNLDVLKIENNDEIAVLFSDIHLWKRNTQEILERIKIMWDDLVNRKERVIHLIHLWDLVETLAKWGMHIWQLEDMDWPFWFDLLMMWVEVLEELILKLYNAWKEVKFYWIWWNHWRLTQKKEDWFNWMWEILIYELIKRWLQNIKVEINILRDIWNTLDIDDIRYIIHHWDDWVAKKAINKWEKILWEFWDSSKFNIIATADQHHLEMNNSSDKSLWIIVPALAWRWQFDTKIWLSSNPWYIIVKKWINWKPNLTTNLL